MNREEAKKLIQQGITELNGALQNGRSETLERYLDVLSRFHRYSFNNAILIAIQNPEATHEPERWSRRVRWPIRLRRTRAWKSACLTIPATWIQVREDPGIFRVSGIRSLREASSRLDSSVPILAMPVSPSCPGSHEDFRS